MSSLSEPTAADPLIIDHLRRTHSEAWARYQMTLAAYATLVRDAAAASCASIESGRALEEKQGLRNAPASAMSEGEKESRMEIIQRARRAVAQERLRDACYEAADRDALELVRVAVHDPRLKSLAEKLIPQHPEFTDRATLASAIEDAVARDLSFVTEPGGPDGWAAQVAQQKQLRSGREPG